MSLFKPTLLAEEITFLKNYVVPSFTFCSVQTAEERIKWMREREKTKSWSDKSEAPFEDLIITYGGYDLKSDAVKYLQQLTALLLQAQGKKSIIQIIIYHLVLLCCIIGGKKLRDGIPELIVDLSVSPPSEPSETEHKPCRCIPSELPYSIELTEDVLNAPNTIWIDADKKDTVGYHLYASEDDIIFFVRTFLRDIYVALGLPLKFSAEVSIKQIRPDLCVVLMGMYLVGVVEVKKPGSNILLKPTVLGEFLDQMLLVEGFYGMGPVIGILTTAEEWVVSWFPVDSKTLACTEVDNFKSFESPVNIYSITSSVPLPHSPPGGTPSQKSGIIHSIEAVVDTLGNYDDNLEMSQQMERVLCCTEVMNIRTDLCKVLQVVCSAFLLMSRSRLHHRANLSRCLLKFHKGVQTVTFHPASHEDIQPMVNFDKFPGKNTKTLIALEDLGRGSTGKAWLCVTITKPRSAACVLKFDNKCTTSTSLRGEKELWNLLYPEFLDMIKLEQWSGSDALVMPHFSTVLEHEREQYKDVLAQVLREKFLEKGKVHKDVRWCNIGKYSSNGVVVIVVFDLHDVVDYDSDVHINWIDNAISSLYI